MSKEIEQNEHYTGKIAMSLDPSLVVKELDTGKDGLITKEAVRKQTSDPQEEIDQMKQTAKDEGAELDADQLARIKELETAAKVKQQEDEVGDATNLTITFVGALLRYAENLFRMGLHVSECVLAI